MPRVTFTGNLKAHIDSPPVNVQAETVREALDKVFAGNPRLRGYILDDQGAVRRHVVIFVNGEPIEDRIRQSDAATGEIAVMQALSGG